MPKQNGSYLLVMTTIVSTVAGNVVGKARQHYGSLAAAKRDADVFVQSGENRRAEVLHEAANGTQSPAIYTALSRS